VSDSLRPRNRPPSDTLVARDAAIAAACLIAGAVVAALWAIHTAVNWFVAGVPYRCQSCGCEAGESQKAI